MNIRLSVNSLRKHFLCNGSVKNSLFDENPVQKFSLFSVLIKPTTYSTISLTECDNETVTDESVCDQNPSVNDESIGDQNPSLNVLRTWGCNENDISAILSRHPALRNADAEPLQTKLGLLTALGLTSADLVKIIHCRPRFLSRRLDYSFKNRIEYLTELFGSKDVLRKAITRNPSLLVYDLADSIKPTIKLYEDMGVSREGLVTMLLSRPTLIPRTSFDDEKLEYIRKTGVQKETKMYKFVVTLIGISRHETIQAKVANFEKFGLTEDEIWGLFGRSPYLMTLSVDKIQRNMTFILGMMKLPASVVLTRPYMLASNLETVIKPRVFVAEKMKDMGLPSQLKGTSLIASLKMREYRFLKVYVKCHPKEVADELLQVYDNAKCIKRLAESSKRNISLGFPF
ncbi:hypothetical protein ACFE04_025276 [Oxalis oulophora]